LLIRSLVEQLLSRGGGGRVADYPVSPLDRQLAVMWSETVGLRTRPVWDQKNRSWS